MDKSFNISGFESFFIYSNDLLAIANEKGLFTRVNPIWEEVLGYKDSELLGNSFLELVHPEDRISTENLINSSNKNQDKLDIVNRYKHKDGFYLLFKWQIVLREENIFLIVQNISEHEKIRSDLKESEVQLKNISDNLPGIMFQFFCTSDGKLGLNYVSNNSLKYLQLDNSDLETFLDRFTSCLPEEDLITYTLSIQNAINNKTNWKWEGNFVLPDGTRKVLQGVSILRDQKDILIYDGLVLDITDEKRAEDALIKSEGILRSTLESVEDAILIVDRNGKCTHYNNHYKKLFKFTNETLSKTNYQLYIEHSVNKLINQQGYFERIADINQKDDNSDDVLNLKDGRIIKRFSFPLLVKEETIGRVWVFRDITIQEKEKDMLGLFKKSIDNSDDSVFWLDKNGKFVYINENGCKKLGYSREEISKISVIDIDPDLTFDQFKSLWNDCQLYRDKGYVGNHFEARHQKKDGSIFPVEVSYYHYWENEKEFHIVNIKDISNRKKEENALRKSEEKYRLLFDNMMSSFSTLKVIFDDKENAVDYIYEAVNPFFENLVNFSADNIIGKSVKNLFPKTEKYWFELFGDVVRTKKPRYEVFYSKELDKYFEAYVYYIEQNNCASIFNDVTDRKKNENILYKFKASIDNSLDGIYWINEESGFDYVNDQACRMLGYTKEELLNLTLKDIDPNVSYQNFKEAWNYFLTKKNISHTTLESKHKRKDGSTIPVELNTVFVRSDEKSLLISFVKDITERKAYEQSLLKNQKLLNDSQRVGKIGSWEYIIQSDELIWNDQVYSIYGIDKSVKPDYQLTMDLVHPDDRDFAIQKFQKILKQRHFSDYEYRIVQPDNSLRYIKIYGNIECDINNNPYRIYGIIQDITQQKKVEESLSLFKMAVDNTNDSVFIINSNAEIVYVNSTTCNLLGYSQEELIHMSIFEINPVYTLKQWKKDWDYFQINKKKGSGNISFESIHQKKDGTKIPVDIIATSLSHIGEDLIISFARDITERKNFEESLLKNQKLLLESQRIAKIGSWELDLATQEFFWSKETYQIYDYEQDSFVTFESFKKKVHQDDLHLVENHYNKTLEEGVFRDIKIRIITSNGVLKWVIIAGEIIFDDNNKPVKNIGIVQDITEQKKAEENLLLFKTSIDQASDEVYWLNKDGGFEYVNQKGIDNLGYTYNELLKMNILDIDPVFTLEKWNEKWNQIKYAKTKQGQTYTIESIHKRKDGSIFPVEILNYYFSYKDREFIMAYNRDISEQKQRQEELLKNQKLLLESQRIAKIGSWELDLATQEFLWSKEAYQIYDYNKEALVSFELFKEKVHPDDLHFIENHYNKTLEEGVFRDLIVRIIAGNGVVKWIIIAGEIIYDEKDVPVKFIGILQDISEQKENEEKIIKEKIRAEESEQRYKALHNASFGGIVIHDKGIILDCNQGLSTITGYLVEELIGMDGLLLIAEEYRDIVRGKIKQQNEEPYEVMGVRKNGEEYPLRLEARNIPYKGKTVRSTEFRDFTKEKETEKQIIAAKERAEESEYFLRESQRIGNIGSFNMDITEDKWISNEILDNIYGIEKGIVKNIKNWEGLYYSEDLENVVKQMNNMISKKSKSFDLEYRIVRNSDKQIRWVHGVGKPFFDKEGNLIQILGTIQDITERKEYERKIKELNIQLEQRVEERTIQLQQANKDLEAFAYSVSHDLRAPIRHINGFLQLLKMELKIVTPKAQGYFHKIDTSTNSMAVMIDELLKFSRLGRAELHYRDTNLNEIIEEIIERFKPDYTNRVIKWEIGNLSVVKGDPALLKIVLENLLSNAIKYTSKKELAIIEVSEFEKNPGSITFIIRDNGAGFDEAYKENLFGVFKRLHTNDEFEGIGIGLANVKQIIIKHGGSIDATSKVDEGATFYITLPR